MATKKGKRKVARKAKATAKKRTAAHPKKAATRRPKRTAARKSAARKAPARSAPKSASKKRRASGASGAATARKPIRRQDRAGHLDPKYAADLLAQGGSKEHEGGAFIQRPRAASDDLAEERAEEVIEKATTGEDEAEDAMNQFVPEEEGGPFVQTNAAQEFAHGTDASNPKGAKREPFPTT